MIYLIALVSAFIIAFLFVKPSSKFLFRAGIKGIDQQKENRPELPTSIGTVVMAGLLGGIFIIIGVDTFLLKTQIDLTTLFAASFSIIIITFIGFLDDVNVARAPKKDKGLKDYRLGLKQWQKPLLVLPAAIPLMAVKAGVTEMALPFIGIVNFGVLYPLILVPLAVVFVTNATNMLAGMNGLESGLGLVTTISIGIFAFFAGRPEAAIIAFSTSGALAAILIFNWYPAKVLPGDSLTYLVGASIVSSIIIGNIERFGIFIFAIWVIEFLLKLRSKFKARTLGNLNNNVLEPPYKKIYSIAHILMKFRLKENQITNYLLFIQILICLLALIMYIPLLTIL